MFHIRHVNDQDYARMTPMTPLDYGQQSIDNYTYLELHFHVIHRHHFVLRKNEKRKG